MRWQYLFVVIMTVLLMPQPSAATDYYVSPSGDDGATGTSPAMAWQTIARVNTHDLDPGDRVLFEGGATFTGNLTLDASDAGAPASPVVITTNGANRAVIDAGVGDGIYVEDSGGIEIRDLRIVGDGPATNTGRGIWFYTERNDGAKLEHVRIHRVDASGFRKGGIVIQSFHASLPGFRDVEITRCRLFDNGETGINVSGFFINATPALSHEDIHIAHCEVFNNAGDPTDFNSHTGSGIIVSATDGAVIEFCHAHHNGGVNSQNSGGPIGIWTWQSNDVVIQFNIANDNKTGGGADGGGFDLDGGVTNSVLQYNYSYRNEGAGYLLGQFFGAPPFHDNVIRYNVSYNDGRRNSYGGIVPFGLSLTPVADTEIYGNTIYVAPAASGTPRAVHVFAGAFSNVNFRNNIFVVAPGVQLVRAAQNLTTAQVLFQGNTYWGSGGGFEVEIGATSHDSLAAWQATGQEMVGVTPVGLHADPLLVNPTSPELLADPTKLAALDGFKLQPGAPVIDVGLDLVGLFGVAPGTRDFYGVPLPQGGALDVGASEDCGSLCIDGDSCCPAGCDASSDTDCPVLVPTFHGVSWLVAAVLLALMLVAPRHSPPFRAVRSR